MIVSISNNERKDEVTTADQSSKLKDTEVKLNAMA